MQATDKRSWYKTAFICVQIYFKMFIDVLIIKIILARQLHYKILRSYYRDLQLVRVQGEIAKISMQYADCISLFLSISMSKTLHVSNLAVVLTVQRIWTSLTWRRYAVKYTTSPVMRKFIIY